MNTEGYDSLRKKKNKKSPISRLYCQKMREDLLFPKTKSLFCKHQGTVAQLVETTRVRSPVTATTIRTK